MKNQNRAVVKTAKPSSVAPAQKRQDHAPLPITPRRPAPFAVLARDPFAGSQVFEITLDWIGDTMEPEIFQGNIAQVSKRENMRPCAGEMVLGLLKSGRLVFGAHTLSDDCELWRIDFINPNYPSVFYREDDFQWLFPVAYIRQMHEVHGWERLGKQIFFERGSDAEARCLAPAAT